ncbi:hypothetical protein EMCRGX_G007673 [Ephydatia muelleri]
MHLSKANDQILGHLKSRVQLSPLTSHAYLDIPNAVFLLLLPACMCPSPTATSRGEPFTLGQLSLGLDFGVRCEPLCRQVFFLIDEAEHAGKGAMVVCSLVHAYTSTLQIGRALKLMGNSSTKDSSEELLQAIQIDDVPSVRKLLQRARSANENALNIDQEGGSLLHCVAANGAIKVLSLLSARQCQTALHRASDKGVIFIVQELIKFTPNVNTRDKRGQTALQLAATKNYAEVARVLLDAKADVNLQEKNGLTALHAACDGGFIGVINDLLEHEADVNIQDKDGCSPLHLAAQSGRKPIVDLLLDKSPRVNIQKNVRIFITHFGTCILYSNPSSNKHQSA